MYEKYWNLRETPFRNVVDDSLIYLTPQHQEAIARLYYLVDQKRNAGILTGRYGVGKTMLLEYLRRHAIRQNVHVISVDAIPNGELPIARHILRSMGINQPVPTLAEALMLLQTTCRDAAANLHQTLVLIDEAQNLAMGDGFYLAHYLCNMRLPSQDNARETPLFTVILAGTEELRESLKNNESLRRRIQLDWKLEPLSADQTAEYIRQHLRAVGGNINIFSQDAFDAIFHYTQGVPRSINNLCDTSLMLGFAAQVPEITRPIVEKAAQDTGLDTLLPPPPPIPLGKICEPHPVVKGGGVAGRNSDAFGRQGQAYNINPKSNAGTGVENGRGGWFGRDFGSAFR